MKLAARLAVAGRLYLLKNVLERYFFNKNYSFVVLIMCFYYNYCVFVFR